VGVEPSYRLHGGVELTVNTVSLDEALADGMPAPALIKIDVEGGAGSVLRGASRLLATVAPAVYLELHGPEEQAAVRDLLLPHGYCAESLTGARVTDPVSTWTSPLWCQRLDV
jgi:hypothetical protein